MTCDQPRLDNRLSKLIPTLLDDEGHVADDLACLTCGYNLRTLHVDGCCPECGADVWASVQMACETPAAWITDAAVGARRLATAGCAFTIGLTSCFLLIMVTPQSVIVALGSLAIAVVGIVTIIVGAGGIVGFTTRNHLMYDGFTARGLSRWCLPVVVLGILAILGIATTPWATWSFWPSILAAAPCLLGSVAAVTMWCAVLVHACKVMRRVSRPDIASFAGRLSWLVALGICAAIACFVLAVLGTRFSLASAMAGLLVLAGLSAASAVLFRRVMWALAAARQQMEKYAREFRANLPDATHSGGSGGRGVGGTA